LKIAHILLENNKILEAHRYAIRNLEWSADALSYELLGNILLKEGRTKEAESIFKEALILSPSNLLETYSIDRIHLNLAVLSSYRTDYQECKKHIASLRTEDIIGCIEAKYIKGQILTSEKKYDEALYIFESILLEYPEVPRILNATGYLLMISNKDLPRAQFLLEKAFNIVKNNKNSSQLDLLNVSNSLGILYQKLNMLDRAGELLKLSYENTPEEYKKLKEKRLKDLENFYNSFKTAE
jgi:tetratricopeptide (TPR) repeat protein